MSLCLATPAMAVALAVQSLSLSCVHSVEKTEWREDWRLQGEKLVLIEARVRGSGAGMEPGEQAVWRDGWWVWPGQLTPLSRLSLAVSGATGSGWRWCAEGVGCHELESWLARDGQAPRRIEISAVGGRTCRPLPKAP